MGRQFLSFTSATQGFRLQLADAFEVYDSGKREPNGHGRAKETR